MMKYFKGSISSFILPIFYSAQSTSAHFINLLKEKFLIITNLDPPSKKFEYELDENLAQCIEKTLNYVHCFNFHSSINNPSSTFSSLASDKFHALVRESDIKNQIFIVQLLLVLWTAVKTEENWENGTVSEPIQKFHLI